MASADLTCARVRELLHYSIITGRFYWRVKRGRQAAGNVAGKVGPRGAVTIRVDTRSYFAHRLAWFYVTGEWPENEIDHRDTKPANNAWLNLRDVTPLVNSQNNIRARPHSRTGLLGVFRRNRPKPFYAQIMADGRLHHLGSFGTSEEAAAAYLDAKRRLHPESTLAQA